MVVLTEEQQRWCTQENLGCGFDDDNPTLEQFFHICETTSEEKIKPICSSTRLWCGEGRGHLWPALDESESPELREKRSNMWAKITCGECIVQLRRRGCPGLEEVLA